MKPVCEIVVKEVLPGVRAMICKELMTKYKLNQSRIAELLGVSQPAVSQYLREIRGNNNKILNDSGVLSEISRVCRDVNEKKITPVQLNNEFCNICRIVKSKGLICGMHRSTYNLCDCRECLTS